MNDISINGNSNISNSGTVGGDFIAGDIHIRFPDLKTYNLLYTLTMDKEGKENALINMTESQKKLANAIEKFAEAELLRAEADKNNSLANLNYSKIMLQDREIIKTMLEKLK